MLQRRIIKLCEKANTVRGGDGDAVLLWRRRWCGAHRAPARGIENIVEGLHQEKLYYLTVRAIDAKIGMFVVDDMTFHGIPP